MLRHIGVETVNKPLKPRLLHKKCFYQTTATADLSLGKLPVQIIRVKIIEYNMANRTRTTYTYTYTYPYGDINL